MPSEILYDTFDIEAETLEAVMPDPATTETNRVLTPFPTLRKSGRRAILSLRTAVLSNQYIHAVIGIDLGGRLLALHDKRTGVDVISLPKQLDLMEGGARGVEWRHGVEVALGTTPRPTALGPMEHLAREPEDDDTPAELLLHEIIAGTGLGLQLTWRLQPDAAELELDVKLLNRTLAPISGASGLLVHFGAPLLDHVWFDAQRHVGLSVTCSAGTFDTSEAAGLFRRTVVGPHLEPHQVDGFQLQLQPITGLPSVQSANRYGAICVGDQLAVLAHRQIGEAKVLLQLESGQGLEAPTELQPAAPVGFDLSSVPGQVDGVAIRDASKQDCLVWTRHPAQNDAGTALIEMQTRLAGKRGAAHLMLAQRALATKDWVQADLHLEEALLYNGDDPLTWWIKALTQRLGGLADGERPELLNAHYLAPLEPALRAEAFLQQNVQSAEPSPLMAPLTKNPEAVMDVACLLIEAGLFEEASRFMDEALRHRELPLLRALTAWLLLRQSRMTVDAAMHITKLEAAPWEPPFPWRQVERHALQELATAFPTSEKVRRWKDLAEALTTLDSLNPSDR